MTNYEWLVNTGKLEEFLADFSYANAIAEASNFYKKYKITLIGNLYALECNVANWLQEEHPKPNQYVLLEDVMAVMNNLHYIPQIPTFAEVIDSYIKYKKDELAALPTKEIEE